MFSVMKFLPTIDLWGDGISTALALGHLKLQRGQWVTCGDRVKHRFVAVKGRSIWVAHPDDSGSCHERFKELCEIA